MLIGSVNVSHAGAQSQKEARHRKASHKLEVMSIGSGSLLQIMENLKGGLLCDCSVSLLNTLTTHAIFHTTWAF